MAAHYNVFVDPCRIAHPKDKPIVERDVQTVREEFRKMLAVNSQITIQEANILILDWSKNKYGMKKHGTTQMEPYLLYKSTELPQMKPLPVDPFELSEWKVCKVHSDHYIQIKTKHSDKTQCYSVPHEYVAREVDVRATANLVKIYYQGELIKQHTITGKYRTTDINDFPSRMKHSLDTGRPFYLRQQASCISPSLEELVVHTLSPNVYVNERRVLGIIDHAKKYPPEIVELASRHAIINHTCVSPKTFKALLETHLELSQEETKLNLSAETADFVRSSDYYTHS